jgi:hypothetical protein
MIDPADVPLEWLLHCTRVEEWLSENAGPLTPCALPVNADDPGDPEMWRWTFDRLVEKGWSVRTAPDDLSIWLYPPGAPTPPTDDERGLN